jgi:hypothetical protein
MLHYYTFEYGVVSKGDAFHVYCSRDRMVGLVVRTLKQDGVWGEGYSRFFVWDEGLGSEEYESERAARAIGDAAPMRQDAKTVQRLADSPSPKERTR